MVFCGDVDCGLKQLWGVMGETQKQLMTCLSGLKSEWLMCLIPAVSPDITAQIDWYDARGVMRSIVRRSVGSVG